MSSIKQKIGDCDGKGGKFNFCGKTNTPLVSSRGHCMDCSKKYKNDKKVDKGKVVGKKNVLRKPTGELAMFLEIWQERSHVCENCGRPLFAFKVHYFDHIKPKGTYPELRLVKSNIQLLCHYWDNLKGWYGCHTVKTFEGKTAFDKRKNSYIAKN